MDTLEFWVSTKMHTTVSCATRQCRVPHDKHLTKKICRVPHDKFHDIFFQNEKSVVCHTTAFLTYFSKMKIVSCTTRQILLLLWKIKYLCRVHFSILNCTRRLFLGHFQTFPIFYDVIQCGMVN